MMAWVGVILLLSLCSFHGVHGIASGESSDPERTRLSFDHVKSVLVTEVHTEYGFLEETSDILWNAAMEHEWSRAMELGSGAQKEGSALRRMSEASGAFPYLVCDVQPGKSGESCRTTVEEHFGVDIRVSNSHGMKRLCLFVLASLTAFSCVLLTCSPSATNLIRRATLSAPPLPKQIILRIAPSSVRCFPR